MQIREDVSHDKELSELAKAYWYLSSAKNGLEDLVADLRLQIINFATKEGTKSIDVPELGVLSIEEVLVHKFDERTFKQQHPSIYALFKIEQKHIKLIKKEQQG